MTDLIERLRIEYARNSGQGAYAWQSRELRGAARIAALEAKLQAVLGVLDEICVISAREDLNEWDALCGIWAKSSQALSTIKEMP